MPSHLYMTCISDQAVLCRSRCMSLFCRVLKVCLKSFPVPNGGRLLRPNDSSVFTAGRIGRWPPTFGFLEQFGRCPPPSLGGDFLGENYKWFGRAVAIYTELVLSAQYRPTSFLKLWFLLTCIIFYMYFLRIVFSSSCSIFCHFNDDLRTRWATYVWLLVFCFLPFLFNVWFAGWRTAPSDIGSCSLRRTFAYFTWEKLVTTLIYMFRNLWRQTLSPISAPVRRVTIVFIFLDRPTTFLVVDWFAGLEVSFTRCWPAPVWASIRY